MKQRVKKRAAAGERPGELKGGFAAAPSVPLPPAHPPRPNVPALVVSCLMLMAWLVFLATLAWWSLGGP